MDETGEANIHASCVALRTRGVLLVGPSGSGKSDLALRLIDEGAKLVADDRTILFVKKGVLHARAPLSIQGLLEIRGLGIVALPVRARAKSVKIALVVQLGREGARLPTQRLYHTTLAVKPARLPPQIVLNGCFASTPAKIRAALDAYAKGAFRDTFRLK